MPAEKVGNRILSYLTGQLIEKRASAVSGELEVWYQNGRYVLHSPDANYSFDTLHRVFQKAFRKLKVKDRNPKKVLILGFGAGSVASILHDELNLSPEITGVEYDPEVIALAYKYFSVDEIDRLTLVREDAAEFIHHCYDRFDLVVSDVFVDKEVPKHILSEEYGEQLVRVTSSDGIGMMNMIAETRQQREQIEQVKKHLQSAGANVNVLRVSSINVMLYWTIHN